MYMPLSLNMEVTGGTTIDEATYNAVALCDRLKINVNFSFNGVKIHCYPTSDPKKLSEEYFRDLKEKNDIFKHIKTKD